MHLNLIVARMGHQTIFVLPGKLNNRPSVRVLHLVVFAALIAGSYYKADTRTIACAFSIAWVL
jgi:hypothetical protein